MKNKYGLITVLSLVMVFAVSTVTMAGFFDWLIGESNFKYYFPKKLKQSIEKEKEFLLVDIQPQEDFKKHHIQGAIGTSAYPVKSKQDKAKLDKILPQLKKSDNDIVIVCPRGGGGAERTYKYLSSQGIKEKRLYILENGQKGWPYNNLLAQRDYSEYPNSSFITGPTWLLNNLNNDNLLVLDARGKEAYDNGHIPGAVAVTWQQFCNMNGKPGDKKWGTVLSADKLAEKLSNIGVAKNKNIVVYAISPQGWGEEGRIVWMLRMAGIKNTKILDGGWSYWQKNNYPVSKQNVKTQSSDLKITELNKDWIINTNQIKILDSRSENEYQGATNFGEARGGHLPGAISLPYKNLLDQNGNLKSPQKLEKIFKEAGLRKGDQIASYCTGGIRSAYLTLVLRIMGYNKAENYDQSFYRWANLKELKLEN
ncbi:rhodanese-related sulfurtransferase [Halobacteroides halobius DSM 5150]|uniref:thiosulfate sulfurtransferase n=1 Tax=Halobacteroides halobius (strain ATCC 35273 / DSM 5150 / MD-1) TaxID=748449 RepID=L0KCG5_HALHC|nr:rhodanese-like domain-containing protein [Halobacteroides halobius]AGB42069.1 rhodanese-related sulfurtransferase [Halobacteroides halobius DSM 5150]